MRLFRAVTPVDMRPVTSLPCYLLTLHGFTHMILISTPGAAASFPILQQAEHRALPHAACCWFLLQALPQPMQRLYALKINFSAKA